MKYGGIIQGVLRWTAGLAALLPLLWVTIGPEFFLSHRHRILQVTLAVLSAVLILLRPKPPVANPEHQPPRRLNYQWMAALTISAGFMFTSGFMLQSRQLEWIGILLLAFTGLNVSLPNGYRWDIPPAMLVLYFAHPLPSAISSVLERGMLFISIQAAERILHFFSVPAWAEGAMLRTGSGGGYIPVWASGMHTAITLSILALVLGILRHLHPLRILLLIAGALLNTLALNAVRLATMIRFAPDFYGSGGGLSFLHDNSGPMLISGGLLLLIELFALEYRQLQQRHKQQMMKAALVGALSEYPPFWHHFRRQRRGLLILVLLTGSMVIVLWRTRPHRRLLLLSNVATELSQQGQADAAKRLTDILTSRMPDLPRWQIKTARIYLMSKDTQAALDALAEIDPRTPEHEIERALLTAYALQGLGQNHRALHIIESAIPGAYRESPLINLIMAELALHRDDPAAAARHLKAIGTQAADLNRIRRFYPYLNLHREWEAIAATDASISYLDQLQAFCAVEAHMHLGNRERVASLAMEIQSRFPGDPRLIEPHYYLALSLGEAWENRFRDLILRLLPTIDSPTVLYAIIEKCIHLARPDLAWTVYHQMKRRFPDSPLLDLAPAKFGQRWFVFRRHWLGFPSINSMDTIDMQPFVLVSRLDQGWDAMRGHIPLSETLAGGDIQAERRQFLQKAIKGLSELRNHPHTAALSFRYASTLEHDGKADQAIKVLDALAARSADQSETVRHLKSEIYERKGTWSGVYETLRSGLTLPGGTSGWPPVPHEGEIELTLTPEGTIRLVEALVQLQLMPAAEFIVQKAVLRYPETPDLRALQASILLDNGHPEQALQALQNCPRRSDEINRLEAKALFQTQRFSEIEPFSRRHMLPPPGRPSHTLQQDTLPPAVRIFFEPLFTIPSKKQLTKAAQVIRHNLPLCGDSLRPLLKLWLQAQEQSGTEDLFSQERWRNVSKDPLIQASAMHQLAFLLYRAHRRQDAIMAAREAVAILPGSASLWRLLISLEGDNPETIRLARRFCPQDTDLWLTALVSAVHSSESRPEPQPIHEQISSLIEELHGGNGFHIAGLTRAAQFLQSKGFHEEAGRICTTLKGRERGLLPAFRIAFINALQSGKADLAFTLLNLTIDASLNPAPELFKHMILLQVTQDTPGTDAAMMNALRALRIRDPGNALWPQMLGWVRFRRGGQDNMDAMMEMNTALELGAKNLTPHLIAAEGYRLLRQYDRAAEILLQALDQHKDHPVLINNLAFTLAQKPKTSEQIRNLLPVLEKSAQEDPRIRDTLALVYIRTGQLEQAGKVITQNLQEATPGNPVWFRSQMRLAEITWRQGYDQSAILLLTQLMQSSRNIPDEDLMEANALFSRITSEPVPVKDMESDITL